jgi:hypothetical protein
MIERAEDIKRAINTAQDHALNLTHQRPVQGHARKPEIYTVSYTLPHFGKLSHAVSVDYDLIEGLE